MTGEDLKQFTLADVARRNGTDDPSVWIVIKDFVYDVTNYVNEHPGGSDLLMEHAGKDATIDFKDAGHSNDAYSLLKSKKIGQIVENERKYGDSKEVNEDRSCLSVICGCF